MPIGGRLGKRSERIDERAEPRFEMAPLVEAVAIDRLADLFRARRADGPLALEEPQALRLER